MPQPIIMDVDTGIDDSLALVYLLASPGADIRAITCTGGNVAAPQVATNNLAWLDLVGAPDIEVALGSPVPVLSPLTTTEETHGPQGIGYAELPAPSRKLSARHAVTVWSDIVRQSPGEVVGLVTGPMTNLALALRTDPEIPGLLKRLVVMGGAFNHPGNTRPTTEWNVNVDPDAAKMVFDAFSGLPAERRPIVCALDLTERIAMTPEHIRRLAEAAGCAEPEIVSPTDPPGTLSTASNRLIKYLSDAIRFYMEFHRAYDQGFIAHMHDPFAAAVALDPAIVTTRPATVDVELAGTLTRGTTVADWAGMWGREPNAAIAVDTDPGAFFDHLIATVGAYARRLD